MRRCGSRSCGFNCAAPFRGRLRDGGYDDCADTGTSIVPPPEGGGYAVNCLPQAETRTGFNCAAPFRGRLLDTICASLSRAITLQLCRPLPGAVTRVSAA